MAKNRIGLDRIEARIGRGEAPQGRSFEEFTPRASAQDDAAPSGGNKLFGLSLALIVVIGGGAFLSSNGGAGVRAAIVESVMGPPPAPAYVSRVAAVCDVGWKDDRLNRDQIHCYMARDVARLCDPNERQALIDKLLAYQAASDRLDGRLAMAALGVAANPLGAVQVGIADAKSRDPNLNPEQRAAEQNKAFELAQGVMAPADKIIAESANETGPETLRADVASLAEHGFLSAADFPDKMPKVVEHGLAMAGPARKPPCK